MDFVETTSNTQRSWSLTEDDWMLDRMRVRCMTVKTKKRTARPLKYPLNVGSVRTDFVFFMTEEVSVSRGKDLTAEATELELSWATGSGLPICCISGLAVTEAGAGSGCRALGETTVAKLLGNNYYWIFHKVALRT